MFMQILSHTPLWVWAVLALLIALGASQARTRQVGLGRATVVPLVFIAFSFTGVIGAFGAGPSTLLEWLAGVVIAALCLRKVVAVRGAAWSPAAKQFTVPGSFIPLTLVVGVFLFRYAVGVAFALHPERAHDLAFASACTLAYGGFAGLFWARGGGRGRGGVARAAIGPGRPAADGTELLAHDSRIPRSDED